MTRWPLPLITTTARLTGNEAKCLLVNLCVGHLLWFWEWSRDGDYLWVGFTVTYSCFPPRAKLRTAGSVTRLQIVSFLFQTLEIFKHVGNYVTLEEFCICQNYARRAGKISLHHRRAKTTWILLRVAVCIPTVHMLWQHWATELRKVCASVNYKKYLYSHSPF